MSEPTMWTAPETGTYRWSFMDGFQKVDDTPPFDVPGQPDAIRQAIIWEADGYEHTSQRAYMNSGTAWRMPAGAHFTVDLRSADLAWKVEPNRTKPNDSGR